MSLSKSLQATVLITLICFMACHSAMAIQISIAQSGSPEALVLEVDTSDTIADLKSLIAKSHAIPSPEQQLSYMGRLLNNNSTLSSYAIQDQSTLILSRISVQTISPYNNTSVQTQLSSHLAISRRFTQGQMNNIWQHINSLHDNFTTQNNTMSFGINANQYQDVYRMLKQAAYDMTINRRKNRSDSTRFGDVFQSNEFAWTGLYSDIVNELPKVPDLGNTLHNEKKSINDTYLKDLPISVWGNGNLEFNALDLKGNSQLFSSKGLTLGIDSQISSTLIIGSALSYGFASDILDEFDSNTDSEQITTSVYMSYFPSKNWSFDTILGYGNLSLENQRRTNNYSDFLDADRQGHIRFASFSLNRVFSHDTFQFRSYLRGDITKIDLDNYQEDHSNSALSFASVSTMTKSTSAGTEFVYHIPVKNGLLTPSFDVQYSYQFSGNAYQETDFSSYNSADQHYNLSIKSTPVSQVTIGTALKYINKAGHSIDLVYRALTASNSQRTSQINLNAKFVF